MSNTLENSMINPDKVKAIALPGIHEHFYTLFKSYYPEGAGINVLDAGAGHGAFSKKLFEDGFETKACDLFPELFYFDQIECIKADVSKELPYTSSLFDAVVSVEVMEHIHDHLAFFREAYRVLNDRGRLFVSTPNILSLKSRWQFFLSGFFYSFKPLEHSRTDGLQHLSSMTVDQYVNIGYASGFLKIKVHIDKKQNSSKVLLLFYPFLLLYCKWKKIPFHLHNSCSLLTGRILFIVFEK